MSRKSGNRFSDKDMRKSKNLTRLRLRPTRRLECLYHSGGSARSSTHSKRRSNDSLACQVVSRLPSGTPPLHGTHRLIQLSVTNRAEARPEPFSAPWPPRTLASEEKEVCAHYENLTHLHRVLRLKLS